MVLKLNSLHEVYFVVNLNDLCLQIRKVLIQLKQKPEK